MGRGAPASIVATVPPQHMYGFETSVLLQLHAPAAAWCGEAFYPLDVRLALEAVPPPRILVTTPLQIRALLQASVDVCLRSNGSSRPRRRCSRSLRPKRSGPGARGSRRFSARPRLAPSPVAEPWTAIPGPCTPAFAWRGRPGRRMRRRSSRLPTPNLSRSATSSKYWILHTSAFWAGGLTS